MDFLTIAVIAVIAMYIGWHLRGITLLAKFGSDPQHFIDILQKIKEINDQEAKDTVESSTGTELAIERHGTMLYAFVKETNQFIAQGNNLTALLDEAKKRYPNRKFFGTIPDGDSAKELVQ